MADGPMPTRCHWGDCKEQDRLLRAALTAYDESQQFGEFEDGALKEAALAYGAALRKRFPAPPVRNLGDA